MDEEVFSNVVVSWILLFLPRARRYRIEMNLVGTGLRFYYTGANGWGQSSGQALEMKKRAAKRTYNFLLTRPAFIIPPITGVAGAGSSLRAEINISVQRVPKK
jgi:hypothetical protein